MAAMQERTESHSASIVREGEVNAALAALRMDVERQDRSFQGMEATLKSKVC